MIFFHYSTNIIDDTISTNGNLVFVEKFHAEIFTFQDTQIQRVF